MPKHIMISAVEQAIEQLNQTLQQAAQAGVTVELERRARIHSGDGSWADQMRPVITEPQNA